MPRSHLPFALPSPRLRWCLFTVLGAAFLLVGSPHVFAAESGEAPQKTASTSPAVKAQLPESGVAGEEPAQRSQQQKLTPMMIEMRAVLDAEHAQLATLRSRFKEAGSAAAALEIQRSVDKLKAETEISLLRIQSRHARKAGRLQLADRIDAAIQEILAPPRRLQPIPRPAPSDVTKVSER